jgi:hypothetical protein
LSFENDDIIELDGDCGGVEKSCTSPVIAELVNGYEGSGCEMGTDMGFITHCCY